MPLVKRAGSPFWQFHLGRKTRLSTGVPHNDEPKPNDAAREFERVHIERLWRLDKLGDRGAISFDEAAQRWLNGSARPRRRDRELVDWLAPHIGIEAVAHVADSDVLDLLRKHGAAAGWSHSTVDRMMGTVSAILKDCHRRGELERTPAIPMYRPPKAEPRWLAPEEFEGLCAELGMHQVLAARFAVHSMLRMRAMGRLEWSRVSFEFRRAWIPGKHMKQAKPFTFPLTDELIRILRALRMLSGPSSPYVFTWNGKPIDDFNTRSFQEAVTRAKVGPLRWHDLRHTGASWAVQSGVTLQELMQLGGWSDYRSVLRYAHLAPTQVASAAERVAQWSHTQRDTPRRERARKHR